MSPAKPRRMPGLWRTVQQLRKGGGSVGGASSADHQNRGSSIASPEHAAGAAVPSPERNGFFSPRAAKSLPGELLHFSTSCRWHNYVVLPECLRGELLQFSTFADHAMQS